MVQDDFDQVELSEDGDVVTLAFDRPDSMNALNTPLVRDFRDSLEAVHELRPKALLLTGKGDATCAGLDLEIAQQDPQSEAVNTFEAIYEEGLELLETFPNPTGIATKGAAVGAGFIYFLQCDFAVVGEETTLMLPEVKYGLWPTGAIDPLESQVGERYGKEIALTGNEVDPHRAYETGMANRVVPEAEVDDAILDLLQDVTQHEEAYEQNVIEEVIAAFDE